MPPPRLVAETALRVEPADHVRPVAERAEPGTAAPAQRDDPPAGIEPVTTLVDDLERATDNQRPVLIRSDHGMRGVAHVAAMPPCDGSETLVSCPATARGFPTELVLGPAATPLTVMAGLTLASWAKPQSAQILLGSAARRWCERRIRTRARSAASRSVLRHGDD